MHKPKDRVYITADKKRLVPEGHVDSDMLYATPHQAIHPNVLKSFDSYEGVEFESTDEVKLPVEKNTPTVRDEPTIDVERSNDVHHVPKKERSSAVDKKIANDASGLTQKLEGNTAGLHQHPVTDRALIEEAAHEHAHRATRTADRTKN